MKFTEDEVALIQEVLHHDGYALLMARANEKRDAIVRGLMSKDTDWEDTVRYRGQLQMLEFFTPEKIQIDYPKSEKP